MKKDFKFTTAKVRLLKGSYKLGRALFTDSTEHVYKSGQRNGLLKLLLKPNFDVRFFNEAGDIVFSSDLYRAQGFEEDSVPPKKEEKLAKPAIVAVEGEDMGFDSPESSNAPVPASQPVADGEWSQDMNTAQLAGVLSKKLGVPVPTRGAKKVDLVKQLEALDA